MKIEELKRRAEAATSGPWELDDMLADITGIEVWSTDGMLCESISEENARYITAANPAAMLELITEIESLRAEVKTERALSFRDQVAGLEKQRDELLAALRELRSWYEDHTGLPACNANSAIANAERQP